ncbi:hypothetical protein F5884DRAFT_801897 [Xylogone sp. PMI_703]|nr:hypothetical protein F5884DRAFT_801897 [Xylogone sp. PMI_703]
MSLRRSACRECRQAKRRCDAPFSQCSRCTARGLQCHYVDFAPWEEEQQTVTVDGPTGATPNAIDTTLEDIVLGGAASDSIVLPNSEQLELHGGELDRPSPLSYSNSNLDAGSTSLHYAIALSSVPSIYPSERPKFWFCVQILKQFPRVFARLGHCGFIHRAVYSSGMPATLRHAYNTCCALTIMNRGNMDIQLRNLSLEVEDLLRQKLWPDSSVTLTENLVVVQALILYQIIRLFSGNVEQRYIAEQQNFYLDMWTQNLEFLSQLEGLADTGSSASIAWPQWILVETVRRTLLMSYVSRGIFWALRHGNIPFRPQMAIMDVSLASHSLWESPSAPEGDQFLPAPAPKDHLSPPHRVPYAIFAEECKSLSTSGSLQLGQFESLLVTACKGREYIGSSPLPI